MLRVSILSLAAGLLSLTLGANQWVLSFETGRALFVLMTCLAILTFLGALFLHDPSIGRI